MKKWIAGLVAAVVSIGLFVWQDALMSREGFTSITAMKEDGWWCIYERERVPRKDATELIAAGGMLYLFYEDVGYVNVYSDEGVFQWGCQVEAISNGVPNFRKPKSTNAASTLLLLGVFSATMLAGILAMAQKMHDDYVGAGVEQRDKIIAEAQIEASGLVTEAQDKSRKILSNLEQQKAVLERKVEQLRGFERDYRSRLKAYIEGQLRDLDARGSVASETADA